MDITKLTYKEYIIPKKGGKVRKIVAPSTELKKHQRDYLPSLNEFFKKEIVQHHLEHADIFHGFVKHKNCVTAATKHIGFKLTIMMDIKHFFDSVQFNYIPREYKLPITLFHQDGYAAQGFPSSPMIANIAIVPVISNIYNEIKSLIDHNFALTVYADDIQISINDPKYIEPIKILIEQAFRKNGYIINKQKTRVRYTIHGWRRILGVNVGETKVRATRKTMRKIRAAKHHITIKKTGIKTASRSLGGLTTWSKCPAPKYTGLIYY